MGSSFRRGKIPRAPQGIDEHLDEIYTLEGFFGEWAHLFRHRNPGFPKKWSSDDLLYQGIDGNAIGAADQSDPRGLPVEILRGDGIRISISLRSQPMPFAERNVDHHQIRFYHRGEFTVDTELGQIETGPGDFLVIPKGLIFRETPKQEESFVLVFETASPIVSAEELWDSVGFTSFFVDYSLIEVPTPGEDYEETGEETEVRVKFRDEWHTLVYDFDPCADVVGWMGDPVIFKMNVWDVPGLGSSQGFMPPPSGAVLMGRNKSFVFNVMGPKPMPSVPAPDGSIGPPGHLNDWDEVWFNHASINAKHTEGHVWRLPPTIPHPGIKKPPGYPPNPVQRMEELKLNFDTEVTLEWTEAGRAAFFPDPQVSFYTSMAGTHIDVVPGEALRYAHGRGKQSDE